MGDNAYPTAEQRNQTTLDYLDALAVQVFRNIDDGGSWGPGVLRILIDVACHLTATSITETAWRVRLVTQRQKIINE